MFNLMNVRVLWRDMSKLHRVFSFYAGTRSYRREYGFFAGLKLAVQLHNAHNCQPPGTIGTIFVPGLKGPIYIRSQTADASVFWQVFGLRHFEIQLPSDPSFIIDAGAHIGLSSLYFAWRYPNAQIIAVEPEISNFELLEKNTSEYKNIIPVNEALWHETTNVRIKDSSVDTWAFQVEPCEANGSIAADSIGGFAKRFGTERIDLLKIDIEGAEREVFSHQYCDWIDRVDIMMVELHERYAPGCEAALRNAISGRGLTATPHGEYTLVRPANSARSRESKHASH